MRPYKLDPVSVPTHWPTMPAGPMAKRREEREGEITVTGAEEPGAMLEQPAGAAHPDADQGAP